MEQNPVQHIGAENHPPLRPVAQPRHPEKIAQQQPVERVARFQRFHNPLAGPVEGGVQAQRFPEMFHRLAVFTALQQRPAAIGVGHGIIRLPGQGGVDGLAGFFAPAQLGQGDGPDIGAGNMLRIDIQSLPGDRQRSLPVFLLQQDVSQEGIGIFITGI